MTPRKRVTGPINSRALLLIAAGLVIALYVGRGCSGVNLDKDEAIQIATTAFKQHPDYFEPTNVDARVLRQGIPSRAVWFVLFSVPDPNGTRDDFLNRATVSIDSTTGEVLGIEVDPDP